MKASALTVEDRDMISRLGRQLDADGVAAVLEYDVRRCLCEEMAALGGGARRLIGLLESVDFLAGLPAEKQEEYRSIMREISRAALEGQVLFMRSRALDKDALLAAMPGEGQIH